MEERPSPFESRILLRLRALASFSNKRGRVRARQRARALVIVLRVGVVPRVPLPVAPIVQLQARQRPRHNLRQVWREIRPESL